MSPPPLAVYVHWPFCLSKCPYCDFNSHVARDAVDHARWRRALVAELEHAAALLPGRRLASLFLGGGTPSLMAPETVAAVIGAARRLWPGPDAPEITLEANPTSVEAGRLAAYRDAGVNRVSLGVQALDDDALAALGRTHSAAEAIAAVETAQRLFGRVSFDLIYARPGQSEAAWRSELRRALALAGEHLSLYQLTLEPGTRFRVLADRGDLVLPDEDTATALFLATQEETERAGLAAYEISNHARPGAESRHNLAYWRAEEYVGIGPGAHGREDRPGGRTAVRRARAPAAWLQRVETEGHATVAADPVDRETLLAEVTLMGLRLAQGIARARLDALFGAGPEALYDPRRLAALRESGDLTLDDEALRASAAGRLRLDAVTGYLLS